VQERSVSRLLAPERMCHRLAAPRAVRGPGPVTARSAAGHRCLPQLARAAGSPRLGCGRACSAFVEGRGGGLRLRGCGCWHGWVRGGGPAVARRQCPGFAAGGGRLGAYPRHDRAERVAGQSRLGGGLGECDDRAGGSGAGGLSAGPGSGRVGRGQRDGVALVAAVVAPDSRGSVRLASADPLAAPLIDPGFLREPRDIDRLAEGLARVREAAASAAFSGLDAREVWPGADVRTSAGLRSYIRRTVGSYYHPAGTCRMGSGADAVVDSQLRVRGVAGLRVADASVIPVLPNAHPHATVLAIAERAAELISRTGAARM
jgi:choline dehydrogenase-like flavoprotein